MPNQSKITIELSQSFKYVSICIYVMLFGIFDLTVPMVWTAIM